MRSGSGFTRYGRSLKKIKLGPETEARRKVEKVPFAKMKEFL